LRFRITALTRATKPLLTDTVSADADPVIDHAGPVRLAPVSALCSWAAPPWSLNASGNGETPRYRLRAREYLAQHSERLADEITDRGQVRAMWQWARDLDRDNLLWREFCRPIEVETGSKEDLAIQLTDGWILGCSPTITNQ
jgi:hypothetical protein